MSTLVIEREALARKVLFNQDSFTVLLDDGRTLSVPLTWFPRLLHASRDELENYELIGDGQGIHWEDLDEDISIEALIAGKGSNESQKSLEKWLKGRNRSNPIMD